VWLSADVPIVRTYKVKLHLISYNSTFVLIAEAVDRDIPQHNHNNLMSNQAAIISFI
jgi:hypothetical protein